MRSKDSVYTSYVAAPCLVNGSGDNFILTVISRVHAGPKAVQGRQCSLILRSDEALELVTNILAKLPVAKLQESHRLAKINRLISCMLEERIEEASK